MFDKLTNNKNLHSTVLFQMTVFGEYNSKQVTVSGIQNYLAQI